MKLRTKLIICVGLSVTALISKMIAIASPGWVIVRRDVLFNPNDDFMERSSLYYEYSLERNKQGRVTISFGVWYYMVCRCDGYEGGTQRSDEYRNDEIPFQIEEESNHEDKDDNQRRRRHYLKHKCYFRSYHFDRIPLGFQSASEFITSFVETARHASQEVQYCITIGLLFGVFGLILSVFYARSCGRNRRYGRMACCSEILSAFFFWMTIIRLVSYYILLQEKIQKHVILDLEGLDKVNFIYPWSLCVAAVGACIKGLSSLFHMLLISREKKFQNFECSLFSHKDKLPSIVHNGYEQLVTQNTCEDTESKHGNKSIFKT
ncbi:uncharacterized protein LOC127702860 [Mytilus californianus]|uniref:uncharacterized protein LOC127702860 n=1 Tax=Mytilus californianus TaxID=6549 RepID=UPI002245DFAF|nr:uncharacterized protein LOC127702860 [Mytilus californianus]